MNTKSNKRYGRFVDGEIVLYGRGVSPDLKHKHSHANTNLRYAYLDLGDITYNKKKGTGSKGKEILAHELGHLKDKKDYSNIPEDKARIHQEMKADLTSAKMNKWGSKDYRRFVQDQNNKMLKSMLVEEPYKKSDINQKINLKDYAQKTLIHYKARRRLQDKWDRIRKFKNFGLRESYIRYLLKNCLLCEVCHV